jgi:hypothetical protein
VTGRAHRSEVPLDTIGNLADRGHPLFGSCLDCARRYNELLRRVLEALEEAIERGRIRRGADDRKRGH